MAEPPANWHLDTKKLMSRLKLKEENIRASAVEYMRRQLEKGKFLSRLLLETTDFRVGDIIALSPTPLSPAETIQFDWGHTPPDMAAAKYITVGNTSGWAVPTPKANDQLVDLTYDSLEGPESVCLMQNWLFDASAEWLQRAKSRVMTHGDDVYHLLTNADRDKRRIEDARREAERLPVFVGAVGCIPTDVLANITSLKLVTTEQLTAFAPTVRSVFIGAYDGEGYIVWVSEAGSGGWASL